MSEVGVINSGIVSTRVSWSQCRNSASQAEQKLLSGWALSMKAFRNDTKITQSMMSVVLFPREAPSQKRLCTNLKKVTGWDSAKLHGALVVTIKTFDEQFMWAPSHLAQCLVCCLYLLFVEYIIVPSLQHIILYLLHTYACCMNKTTHLTRTWYLKSGIIFMIMKRF